MKLEEAEFGVHPGGGGGHRVPGESATFCEVSPALTLWARVLPYQGQLLSELDDHPLVRSGQGDEVEHDEAATQGREVTGECACAL